MVKFNHSILFVKAKKISKISPEKKIVKILLSKTKKRFNPPPPPPPQNFFLFLGGGGGGLKGVMGSCF